MDPLTSLTKQPRDTQPSGIVDVSAFDMLTADHRLVHDYFDAIEKASQASLAADRHRKPDLIRQVCDELDVHMRVEEAVFYPALRVAFNDSDDKLVEHSEEEHAKARSLIERLRTPGNDDSAVDSLVQQLREAVEHHVHDEEERLFPFASPRVDGAALGRQMTQQKRAILEAMGQVC
jgi:hemerythrin-like domain-containing protein